MLDVRALEAFEASFGSAGRALSRLIRPAIAARQGRTLVWGDWAAIEARVLPWLADTRGANEVLDVIRAADADPENLPDLYCREAAALEKMGVDEFWAAYRAGEPFAKSARQLGKVEVLSLGFGGAVGALQNMATGYGISLTEAECQVIVDTWRSNNRWARGYWDTVWEAFLRAMENPDTIVPAGRVAYMYDKGYLGGAMFCFLPDGRPLVYPRLRWEKREREDREGNVVEKTELTYRRGHTRRSLWYGVLAENNTQATAGSLLRDTLARLAPAEPLEYDKATPVTYPALALTASVVGHTHDEVIVECQDTSEDVALVSEQLNSAMVAGTDWSEGLPLVAEITSNWYYTKTKG